MADGKLILFSRQGDNERVQCLDAASSKAIWSADYPTAYQDDFGFDDGPRATPSIDGNHVYTFGAEGSLRCWDLGSGKPLWAIDTTAQFHQSKGFFGMACSPLIEGDAVILNVGGRGAGVVAFDKGSGKVMWQATDDEASYASPVAATFGGKRYVLALTRSGLDAFEPTGGRVLFRFPWRSPMNASVNAATPLVIDDRVFVSASYETGAALLRFREAGPEKIWSGDDILSNHYARGKNELVCVDLRAKP